MRNILFLSAALMLAGCQPKKAEPLYESWAPEVEINRAIVQHSFEQNARSAAVAQRLIFPHHFQPMGSALNGLGELHVQALSEAIGAEPVSIRVGRGDASAELYEKRLAAVREQFAKYGTDLQKLSLSDGLAGGPGMASARVRTAYENADAPEAMRSTDIREGSESSIGGTRSNTNGGSR